MLREPSTLNSTKPVFKPDVGRYCFERQAGGLAHLLKRHTEKVETYQDACLRIVLDGIALNGVRDFVKIPSTIPGNGSRNPSAA